MTDGIPTLTDGVVTLRAHVAADLPDVVAMATDLETVRRTGVPVPYDHRHAGRWIGEVVPGGWADGSAYRWAVAETASDRFAGQVDVRTGPPPDLGFATAPWARGRGWAARAVRLATRWAFDVAGLPVVHWSAHAGHLESWRVAHACGFTFHGERPLSIPFRGRLVDGWSASLRPGDAQAPAVPWWPVPVLEAPRVRLRPFTDADVPRVVEACSDPRTRHWLGPLLADPYTEEAGLAFVRGAGLAASLGRGVAWAVTAPDDDRMLAYVGLLRMGDPLNPTGCEIGYWAHPDARGRGVVGAAVRRVVEHAFAPLAEGGMGRHRVMLGAGWGNTASRNVAERTGFTLVGRHRQDGTAGVGPDLHIEDGAWYDRLATDGPV